MCLCPEKQLVIQAYHLINSIDYYEPDCYTARTTHSDFQANGRDWFVFTNRSCGIKSTEDALLKAQTQIKNIINIESKCIAIW